MLPDALRHLHELETSSPISDIEPGAGFVQYKAEHTIKRDGKPICTVRFHGKIDGEGFCQHVTEIPPIHELSLSSSLSLIIPELREFLAEFIFDIAPAAIRNKLAVLHEGVISFSQFYYTPGFKPSIDAPARNFLTKHNVVIIRLTKDHRADMEAGFSAPELRLRIDPTLDDAVAISESHNAILFFASEYSEEENQRFDGVFYKLSGILNLVDCGARAIAILKNTRDHVVPLRRQLAITLQRNTEEHFSFLTEMKKYLTYANVKLPVVQKVINHLKDTRKSKQCEQAMELASNKSIINSFTTTRMLSLQDNPGFMPIELVSRLAEDLDRLEKLYEEDEEELKVLSNEASQVLQGTLSAEDIQLSIRKLDTGEASLELDRAAKNRANALKILSILLSINTGITIADVMHLSAPLRSGVALIFVAITWVLIEWYIRLKSRYYRLVIPLNWTVPRDSLFKLQQKRSLKRSETNGSRRIRTWDFNLYCGAPGMDNSEQTIKRLIEPESGHSYSADITVDYEQRGFLHSITIEIESNSIKMVDSRAIVVQILKEFSKFGCVAADADRKSVLADALSRLDLFIDVSLPSLNWVLVQDPDKLRRILSSKTAISSSLDEYEGELEEYVNHADEILSHFREYKEWLTKADQKAEELGYLLGKATLPAKLAVISNLELNL